MLVSKLRITCILHSLKKIHKCYFFIPKARLQWYFLLEMPRASHHLKFFILFLISLLLISCAHLNSSCLEVNWYEIGRQDSTRGRDWDQAFSNRRKICPIKSNSQQTKAYKNGFDAGLREYCSFKTGYIYGLSQTEQKIDSCPKPLKAAFQKGYTAGLQMIEIQKLQNDIQSRIQGLEQSIQLYNKEKQSKSLK